MEIIWSPRAESEYVRDLDYLEENFGRKAATNYMEQLLKAIEKISKTELISYQLVDVDRGIRKFKINSHKNLYYRIEAEDRIEIIAFYSDKQDPDKLKF